MFFIDDLKQFYFKWKYIRGPSNISFFTEDVKFGSNGDSQDTQAKVEGGETIDTKNGEITEEDVNERFIDINLGEFGNNVSLTYIFTLSLFAFNNRWRLL